MAHARDATEEHVRIEDKRALVQVKISLNSERLGLVFGCTFYQSKKVYRMLWSMT